MPEVGNAFELVDAVVGESDAGSSDEVLDGAGGEHLARPGERGDPRPDVYGDAVEIFSAHFAFAGVDVRTNVDAASPSGVDDGLRAVDGTCRAVECREEAVARGADLTSLET